jgi:S1-C subfamily serine protease
MRAGDVVTAVNGEPIDSFDALKEFVRTQRPGRRIRLSILRGEESLEKRVRLAGSDVPLPGADDPSDD